MTALGRVEPSAAPSRVTGLSAAYPEMAAGERAALLDALDLELAPPGAFVLSTCLRLELCVEGDRAALSAAIEKMGGVVPAAARIRDGAEAVEHLFRVAAGLESPVLGEREILTQFRAALVDAQTGGRVRGHFSKLLEAAVATGREARQALPASPHLSMAAVAAQLVGTSDRVAVIGTGQMGKAVTEALLALPARPKVTVVARNPEKAGGLAVEQWNLDRLGAALADFPAVISATSAHGQLMPVAEMQAIVDRRTSPLRLIDMAMPPDFDWLASPHLDYLSIDDLARRAYREIPLDEAARMTGIAAGQAYHRITGHHQVGPVIAGLMSEADSVVERVVDRFAGRLENPDDRTVLRQAAHTVARTLLAKPVGYLNSVDRSADAAEVMADAFGLLDD